MSIFIYFGKSAPKLNAPTLIYEWEWESIIYLRYRATESLSLIVLRSWPLDGSGVAEQVQVGDGRRTRKAGSVWCAGLVQAARSQCHREQSCTKLDHWLLAHHHPLQSDVTLNNKCWWPGACKGWRYVSQCVDAVRDPLQYRWQQQTRSLATKVCCVPGVLDIR